MWEVEIYIVRNSVAAWVNIGKFDDIPHALRAISECYALESRVKNCQTDNYHAIAEIEDGDYVRFEIGEVCNHWPQFIGNVRGNQ